MTMGKRFGEIRREGSATQEETTWLWGDPGLLLEGQGVAGSIEVLLEYRTDKDRKGTERPAGQGRLSIDAERGFSVGRRGVHSTFPVPLPDREGGESPYGGAGGKDQ